MADSDYSRHSKHFKRKWNFLSLIRLLNFSFCALTSVCLFHFSIVFIQNFLRQDLHTMISLNFSLLNVMKINMSLGKWSINKMEKYDTLHLILYIERELPRVNLSGEVFWNRSLSSSFLVFCVFVSKRGGREMG